MSPTPHIIMAAVWGLIGAFVTRWPETLAGYNTMPPERRAAVDIRGAGRLLARASYLSAAVSLAGAAAGETLGRTMLMLPIGIVLAAAVAGQRHDMYAMARRVRRDKERFMPLLLVGDESERMIRSYLDRAELYVCHRYGLFGSPIAVCAVTDEGDGVFEVKNLAVDAAFRGRGHGRRMLAAMAWRCRCGRWLTLGTGETPSTLAFYRSCGFSEYGRIAGFFTDNYDRPIVEEGVTLRDMILLRKRLRN